MKQVALDATSWRDGRVGRDGLRLVGVHRHQDFLIDKEARPGHQRAHPLAQASPQKRDLALPLRTWSWSSTRVTTWLRYQRCPAGASSTQLRNREKYSAGSV